MENIELKTAHKSYGHFFFGNLEDDNGQLFHTAGPTQKMHDLIQRNQKNVAVHVVPGYAVEPLAVQHSG